MPIYFYMFMLLAILLVAPASAQDFGDYKADTSPFTAASAVDLSSSPEGKRFKTVLTEGFKGDANFAGHYIVIENGCGSPCQMNWIVDKKTGKILERFDTAWGADFKLDSTLIVTDAFPPKDGDDLGMKPQTYNLEDDILIPLTPNKDE